MERISCERSKLLAERLHWYRVRLLLEGVNRSSCAEAVDEIQQELLTRPYMIAPEIEWETEQHRPIFCIDVQHKNAVLAAEILQEELWEIAGAFLPIEIEYSVSVIGVGPLG